MCIHIYIYIHILTLLGASGNTCGLADAKVGCSHVPLRQALGPSFQGPPGSRDLRSKVPKTMGVWEKERPEYRPQSRRANITRPRKWSPIYRSSQTVNGLETLHVEFVSTLRYFRYGLCLHRPLWGSTSKAPLEFLRRLL